MSGVAAGAGWQDVRKIVSSKKNEGKREMLDVFIFRDDNREGAPRETHLLLTSEKIVFNHKGHKGREGKQLKSLTKSLCALSVLGV
jgi:hypothetical protein